MTIRPGNADLEDAASRLVRPASRRTRSIQERKLRRLVAEAGTHVPYYRDLFRRAGVRPEDIRTPADLRRLPVTTKRDLLAVPVADRLSSRASAAALEDDYTSGSSGQRLEVLYDSRAFRRKNLRFGRALLETGYRPGHKLMMLTEMVEKKRRRGLRWTYAGVDEPSEDVLARIRHVRPGFVYGCLTPLLLVAERILTNGDPLQQIRAVISTAESLDASSRKRLELAFGATVFDFYGLTELGLVARECRRHDGYHIFDRSIVCELLPHADGAFRLVLTGLDSLGMPFLRYDSGDLVSGLAEDRCVCGSAAPRLNRMEGRRVDCIRLRDGRVLSPYRFIGTLETVEGLSGFRVVQRAVTQVELVLDQAQPDRPRAEQACRTALDAILAGAAELTIRYAALSKRDPGRKTRLVESKLDLDR